MNLLMRDDGCEYRRPPVPLPQQPTAPHAAPPGCMETGTTLLPARPRFWCSVTRTSIAQGHCVRFSGFTPKPSRSGCRSRSHLSLCAKPGPICAMVNLPLDVRPKFPLGAGLGAACRAGPHPPRLLCPWGYLLTSLPQPGRGDRLEPWVNKSKQRAYWYEGHFRDSAQGLGFHFQHCQAHGLWLEWCLHTSY